MTDGPGTGESKVELVKRDSRHLRGTIMEAMAGEGTHFGGDDVHVLKFHGAYQQDDRDLRHQRRKAGLEDAHQFMVRCSIPAGVLTAEQYLALDAIADEFGAGSLRVTARQGLQFHGVIRRNLRTVIARINEKFVTTLGACGDAARNVMSCSAPPADPAHESVRRLAHQIASRLRPATRAYHEVWLDGERQCSTEREEPFYGDQYLPRKFKTGIAAAGDNCVDIYTNDLGLIALTEADRVIGFNMVVGGGMGMTHGKQDTVARLADPLGFVELEYAADAARTVAAIFRDFGNRTDRRHARLKYVLIERGVDWFHGEFKRRIQFKLEAWRPMPELAWENHLGRHRQSDGTWFYGVLIESGRIRDDGTQRIKSALRRIVQAYRPGVTLTPHQNLLLTGLDSAAVDAIERTLIEYGVRPEPEVPAVRRYSMACPALPTCGLAMAESERLMPSVLRHLEREIESLGLRDGPIALRMTGCPNGCVRPYTADIALVGRRPNVYHVYVGGGLRGNRLVDLYASDVHVDDLLDTVRPLLAAWARHRRPHEGLGDFYQRLRGCGEARRSLTGRENPTSEIVGTKAKSLSQKLTRAAGFSPRGAPKAR